MPKYLNNLSDSWYLGEDIPDIDFHFSQIWLSAFVNDMEKAVGLNYAKILCIYNGYNLVFYYGEKDSDVFAKHVLGKIIDDPKFGDTINANIRKYSDQLKQLSHTISAESLAKMSNGELKTFLHQLDALHTTLYTWGWLPNAVDMFHGNFTNHLKSILATKVPEDEVNQALVALSIAPEKSILQQEHEAFLDIVKNKQAGAADEAVKQRIQDHLNQYFYLKHLWIGKDGVYTNDYYAQEMDTFIASGQNAAQFLQNEQHEFEQSAAKRAEWVKKLQLDAKTKHLFDVYAEFSVTKVFRRDAQIFWAYQMNLVFAEIAKRLSIPVMQAQFMLPSELYAAVEAGSVSDQLKSELGKRTRTCVYFAEKGFDLVVTGAEADKLEKQTEQEVDHNITEFTGQTACLGKATGRARIINSASDMHKMEPGDILVSIATNPDVVPAMKRAGAIVTEQGGITSHAAIVSRELRIPCIIGTKIATRVLKDGDMVEVDADRGVVRKIL